MRHPIPDAALDDRLFFAGTAGTGKTYNAMGRVERLLKRKNRVVIPDPLGVWWGLRLMPDGKAQSPYDVVIFGGPHGDLPLTEHAGALIGETVAGMKESCILDLSQIGTKAAERRFMLPFLAALYKHVSGEPVHVVFDEADMWAPQRLLDKEGDAAKLLGMMETIVRRGRVKGFIPWLISQRPAVISKDVLSQVDGLIAFKLTSSQDRDAIGDWVQGQADKQQWKDIWAQLPTMERGQGVVWIPGRGILDTVQFPEKETFDSSRTPKRGEKVKRAAKLRPLNLEKLRDRLAKVDAEQKADNPKLLRAENAALRAEKVRLERQVADALAKSARAKPGKPDKADPRSSAAINALRKALEATMKFIVEINAKDFFKAGGEAVDKKSIEKAIAGAMQHITGLIQRHLDGRSKEFDRVRQQGEALVKRLKGLLDEDVTLKVDVRHNAPFTVVPTSPVPRPRSLPAPTGDGTYTAPQMKVLMSLAMWRSLGQETPSREMVAAVAGYSPSSGGFYNLLGGLKTMGAIDYPQQGQVTLVADGIGVMSQQEGIALLLSRLTNPQKKIVAALVDQGERTREDIAADTSYSASSGGFNNLMGSLRSIDIIDYPSKGKAVLTDWAQGLLTGQADRIAA